MVPRPVMPAQENPFPTSSPGILIVDDDQAVLSLLQKGLSMNGFTVWQANNGKDAIETYKTNQKLIAAVLLDVRMPDLDGPAAICALRTIDPDVRCCLMSGDIGKYTAEELFASGAVHIFSKPFALSEVVRVLGQMVSDYQTQVA